jgi:lysozyme family protein
MTDVTTALADPRFAACWPNTLIQECPLPQDWSNVRNFSNDAHDPGGETMCGLIQREYDAYRKKNGLPLQDVSKISRDEGADIYYNSYWLPECPKLAPGLDMQFFDEAVNGGPSAATRLLQLALGIRPDGQWGPQTDASVKAITDVATVVLAFTNQRAAWYRRLSGYKYFGVDWERRTQEIGTESLEMVV